MIKKMSFVIALARVAAVPAILTASACGDSNPVAVSIKGDTSQSLTVPAGKQFIVTLQTIGAGEYSSPPSISSTAVRFLDVAQASFVVPAGPTQEFRFAATARGQAIVVFQNTGMTPTVQDTINVR
jgi:Na+-transporting NADH:ubiquinone oxidoreductase subunit NqrF